MVIAISLLLGIVLGLVACVWLMFWTLNSEYNSRLGFMDDLVNGERSKRNAS